MRAPSPGRRRGAPCGPRSIVRTLNGRLNASALAIETAYLIAPTPAAKSAVALLRHSLVLCHDRRGRPFVAARMVPSDKGLTAPAGTVLRRARRRNRPVKDVQWLQEATGLLTAWFVMREAGRDASTVRAKLAAIDPEFPKLVDRLDNAITNLPLAPPNMRAADRERVPGLIQIVTAFRKRKPDAA